MGKRLKKALLVAVVIAASRTSGVGAAARKSSGGVGRTSKGSGIPSNNIDANVGSFTSRAELKEKKKAPPAKGGGAATKSGAASSPLGFGRPLKSKRPSKLKPLGSN
ncbi:MAG: hypothetical protein ACHQ2Z_03665 [Elusimicrobiota bacterium]